MSALKNRNSCFVSTPCRQCRLHTKTTTIQLWLLGSACCTRRTRCRRRQELSAAAVPGVFAIIQSKLWLRTGPLDMRLHQEVRGGRRRRGPCDYQHAAIPQPSAVQNGKAGLNPKDGEMRGHEGGLNQKKIQQELLLWKRTSLQKGSFITI